ncbi:MAG: S8 family peptidase [Lachnospiraceae bacterium]|nr:S8 family peptidase [Lachnospiraceae bacterium]MDE6186267.1 S8 family peptidase [Lachnospiraceae bacterium]
MLRVRQQVGCSDELVYSCGNKGITIAMLDTGIAVHPDFHNRIVDFKDFVNEKRALYDDSGHGTHVAGCLCGSGQISKGQYRGIAPHSRIVVGKVLDYLGDGNIETMVRGIEWVLEKQRAYDIRILNISIGMGEDTEKGRMEKLVGLVDEAWDRGIVVVCAAGNMGPKPMTISPLGARRKVITVGCHEGGYFGNREHLCENYSSRGPSPYAIKKPDVVAPGTDIVSCNAGIEKRGRYYRNAYIKKSGTSMATPVVSGGIALLLQKYPFYTNEQAKQKLLYTSRDLKEPWSKQGWGMIQIDRLLK